MSRLSASSFLTTLLVINSLSGPNASLEAAVPATPLHLSPCTSTSTGLHTTRVILEKRVSNLTLHLAAQHPEISEDSSSESTTCEHTPLATVSSTLSLSPSSTLPMKPTLLPTKQRRNLFIVLLATTSGMAHVICSHNYDFFANMMTGNSVRWTFALSRGDHSRIVFFGMILISYTLGASIFRFFELAALEKEVHENRFEHAPCQGTLKLRTLAILSPISLLLFCSSDILHQFLRRHLSCQSDTCTQWRLASLALGFGAINAAAQDSLNTVTNAATGHITRIGVGMADALVVLQKLRCRKKTTTSTFLTTSRVLDAAQSTVEATLLSLQFLGALFTSLVLSAFACRRRLFPMQHIEPVIGSIFGVIYACLLHWFAAPFVPVLPWNSFFRSFIVGKER